MEHNPLLLIPSNEKYDTDLNSNECSICFDNINNEEIKKLECGHIFHKKCINDWLKINPICPYCRKYTLKFFNCKIKINLLFKKCKIYLDEDKFSKIYIKFLDMFNKDKQLVLPVTYIKYVMSKKNLAYVEHKKTTNSDLDTLILKFDTEENSYHFTSIMKKIFKKYLSFYENNIL